MNHKFNYLLKEKQPYFIILVENKSDLEFDRQISFEEGLHSANEINVLFAETSAKDRQSVHDAFSQLILHANLLILELKVKKRKKLNNNGIRKILIPIFFL